MIRAKLDNWQMVGGKILGFIEVDCAGIYQRGTKVSTPKVDSLFIGDNDELTAMAGDYDFILGRFNSDDNFKRWGIKTRKGKRKNTIDLTYVNLGKRNSLGYMAKSKEGKILGVYCFNKKAP